jgi:uncharacterized protein YndB with AHSA1/START domain
MLSDPTRRALRARLKAAPDPSAIALAGRFAVSPLPVRAARPLGRVPGGDAMSDRPSLTIRRRFAAPPATVFSAWTEASKLARWFGPARVTVVEAEVDARVGGRFHVVLREIATGDEHEVGGVYREVTPYERLRFTWAWRSTPERESLVTVTLKGDGDGTALTLTHEQFADDATRERHDGGWTGSLDKLAAFLG